MTISPSYVSRCPIHFSSRSGQTLNLSAGIPDSQTLDWNLTTLNRKISDKGKNVFWLPLEDAKKQIDQSKDINQTDKFDKTFLHYAVNPNSYDLNCDSRSDYPGVKRPASNTENPYLAHKYKDLVKHVLNKNPDVNVKGNGGDSALDTAINFAHIAAHHNDKNVSYPGLYAAIAEVVTTLLERGALVKKSNWTVLPKNDKKTQDLRQQVKQRYKEQNQPLMKKVFSFLN